MHLRSGQFFGEIALLRDGLRTATVTAVTEVQLLTLDAADFRRLIEQYPDLAEDRRIADSRLSGESEPPPASTPSRAISADAELL